MKLKLYMKTKAEVAREEPSSVWQMESTGKASRAAVLWGSREYFYVFPFAYLCV